MTMEELSAASKEVLSHPSAWRRLPQVLSRGNECLSLQPEDMVGPDLWSSVPSVPS